MNRIEQKNGRGTEADAKVLVNIEQRFLQDYLSHLSEIDHAAVSFARFRIETLKDILQTFSSESRVNKWRTIEETDRAHVFCETYQSAVWVLELLDPPLSHSKEGKGHVLLFLNGKGSAYTKDDEGNVKPKVATE